MKVKKPGLRIKLLSLMADIPKREVGLGMIFREYEARYKNEMSPSDFEIDGSGNTRWKHSLQGEITECRTLGLLISPARGYWQITKAGRQWVQRYPSTPSPNGTVSTESSRIQGIIEMNSNADNVYKRIPEGRNLLKAFGDFFVPLMRILDDLPNRTGRSGEILLLFEKTYRDKIVSDQYTQNQSGNIRWEHNVRWSREKLKLLGFIDAPQHGIWHLTENGHLWLM
jgi:hypothetical protein